ncbi:MAG: TetR/AcrR family transcriptional regulator [Hyphomicrobiales bacterium]
MDAVNMSRETYHHGNLKPALLEAGFRLLDEGGVDAVTVRALARQAGVAHSAPANHFRDRAALMSALAATIFEDLGRRVAKALTTAPPTRDDRLHVFCAVVVRFALRHPNRYRLMWRRDLFGGATKEVDAAGGRLYADLKAALTDTGDTVLASESDVIAAWSLIHGYLSLRIDGVLTDGRDQITGKPRSVAIVDVLIHGLARQAGKRT